MALTGHCMALGDCEGASSSENAGGDVSSSEDAATKKDVSLVGASVTTTRRRPIEKQYRTI
jgi:hypothetical protein